MQYFLWVRWSPECKEAFEITEESASCIEKSDFSSNNENHWFYIYTPTGKTIKMKLLRALAYKIVTREINPLEDDSHYDDPLS